MFCFSDVIIVKPELTTISVIKLQWPLFWSPNFSFYNANLPLDNEHLSTTATDVWSQGWLLCSGVNFINVKHTNFLYERHFGSLYYVHVTRKKLPKRRSYEKFACLMLMKLTEGVNSVNIHKTNFTNLHKYESIEYRLMSWVTMLIKTNIHKKQFYEDVMDLHIYDSSLKILKITGNGMAV